MGFSRIYKPRSGGSTDDDLTVEEKSSEVVEVAFLASLHTKKNVTLLRWPSTVEVYVTDP